MARPRKPKALLKLHGTEREDRHAERFDDSTMAVGLVKPSDLSDDASRLWDELVPHIEGNGTAKAADRPMVISACQWWARYMEASRRLDSPEYADANPVVLNQLLALAGSAWKNFNTAAGKLGLSPADRAKLAADPKPTVSDFDADISKHG